MKKKQNSKSNSCLVRMSHRPGFSLVELLIVMAIIVIMTSVLFSTKNNGTASKEVEAAAQQLVAQLRSLQNEALSGKKIETSPGVWQTACTFNFSSVISPYTLNYFNDCSFAPSNLIMSSHAVTLKNVTLTSGSVFFQAPLGETNANVQFAITSSKDPSIKIYVLVNKSGSIDVSKTGS